MSSSTNSNSTTSRRDGVNTSRGIPRKCQCGEEALIRTSETPKNPGRLFYCCPYGSIHDKRHLFKWTDIAMVEEMEQVESVIEKIQLDMETLTCETRTCEAVASSYGKDIVVVKTIAQELEELKSKVISCEKEIQELRSFKNMTVCGLVMVLVYYFWLGK